MKGFGRILLSIACTGILQTALATADVQANSACIATAAISSEDGSDCSRSGTSNGNSRPHSGSIALEDSPPKPKGFSASSNGLAEAVLRDEPEQSDFVGFSFSTSPIYFLTHRLRI